MPKGNFPSSAYKRGGQGTEGRLLIILLAVSVGLFTLSCREGDAGVLHSVRGGVTVVTTPVRYVGSLVASPFIGLGNVFQNLTSSQETLSDLKAENEELTAKNAELSEADQTATRLESLLGLKNTYNLQSTAARIVSGSTDSWSSTVTIDKGTSSGLAVGMPVTDSEGIIGQISECGVSSSVVRLITDESSSVSAMVQSSRAQGMLTGSIDGTLKMTLVRSDQTVAVGDLIVTSGLGGVYPKGLPLGKVTNVDKPSGALYYDITVSAFASTENYEEVLVITSITEDQTASDSDVAAADSADTSAATTSSSDSTTDSATTSSTSDSSATTD